MTEMEMMVVRERKVMVRRNNNSEDGWKSIKHRIRNLALIPIDKAQWKDKDLILT